MMWIFSFFLISLLTLKDQLFLSSCMDPSADCLFMLSLVPLNFFLVSILMHFSESMVNISKTVLLFSLILFPVGFSFLVESPLWFLILLEASVLPTSLSILTLSKDEDKISSVLIMLIINLAGSVPFMLVSVWFEYSFQEFWPTNLVVSSSYLLLMSFLLLLCSKLPLAMFHFWLTKAHVAASACVSMFLASLLLKLGTFGLYKFVSLFLGLSPNSCKFLLPWCILFSVVFSMIMFRFVDMKMLVALSSILHMSLMAPLICLGESFGVLSMLMMMMGHGLVSYFFFMVVSVLYENSLSRSTHYNKGSESSHGSFYLLLFSLAFLNMGVPPFINFMSEVNICSSLIMNSWSSLVSFGFTMLLSILFCMFLVSKSIFSRKNMYVVQELEISLFSSFWIFLLILTSFPLLY